jgi:hypothetical protein
VPTVGATTYGVGMADAAVEPLSLDAGTPRADPDRQIEYPPPRHPGRFRGVLALMMIGLSVGLMAAVGVAGPSAAVPDVGTSAPWPPWFWRLGPADLAVGIALWTAIVLGVTGVLIGLSAIGRGWRPRVRHLVAGGILAVVTLAVVPPAGSTDMMDYATYGRAAVLGYDPHLVTPRLLRDRHDDPVAARSSPAWVDTPSVYGPAATVSEWAASSLAGPSAAKTGFWLKVWNGLAFLLAALSLDRMVHRDRLRRLRAHLLWTLNPLMLWAVMVGGHIDGLAMGFAAAALWVLHTRMTSRPVVAGGLAGLLLGIAAAVKAPYALIGAGLLWPLRRSRRLCAALSLAMAMVLVPSYLLVGGEAIRALLHRGEKASPASLWLILAAPFDQSLPAWFLSWGVLAVTLALAAIFMRGLPAGAVEFPAVRGALALCLAWLVTTPVYHSWYDVMVLPLLALIPASGLDGLLVVRGAIAAFAFLPGVVSALRPAWLNDLGHHPLVVSTVPIALMLLTGLLVWRSARGTGDPPATMIPRSSPV